MKKIIYILLGLLVAGYVAVTVVYNVAKDNGAFEPPPAPPVVQLPEIQGLLNATNAERVKASLPVLALNPQLNTAAANRCADMVSKNYYSHVAPDGTQWYEAIHSQIPNYKHAGENIAAGSYTSQSVTDAFMASPEHKVNILGADFTDVGFAVCHSDNKKVFGPGNIVVEDFIQYQPPAQAVAPPTKRTVICSSYSNDPYSVTTYCN